MDIIDDFEELFERDLVEIVEIVNLDRHVYTVRPRTDHFNNWNDSEFIQRFRLSKHSVQEILGQIEETLRHRTNRNRAVLPLQQLLLTLRFLATGSFYITIADFGGIHKSTAANIIQRVITALSELRQHYIKFPQSLEEKNSTAVQFSHIARFPRVVGCIDCTHIRLQSPGGANAEYFRNRKGYFSLNVQVICNANNTIIDIVARWPGSAHDTHIFNNSSIMMRFETGEMGNLLLLGDSGYPLQSYLMTPIAQPATEAERLYNESQIRTRNVVERTFGIWKRRFPILSIGLRCRLPLAQKIIVTTAILHNIACRNNDDVPLEAHAVEGILGEALQEDPAIARQENNIVRRTLIQYFASLL